MGRGIALFTAIIISLGTAMAEDPVPEAAAVPLLEEKAAPFIHLREDLAYADETPLTAAKVTRDVHKRLNSHDPEAVAVGQIAFAALIAADTPAFAEAIERRANKPRNREQFLADLRANPAMVRELDGVDEAIMAIRAASLRDSARISQAGDRYIANAYKLQQTGWARSKLATNGPARLNEARAFSSARTWPMQKPLPAILSKAGNRRPNLAARPAWTPAWAEAPAGEAPIALDTARQIYLTKALVVAARYALDDLNEGHIDAFASDKTNTRCYKMAMLNFDQCIAATRTSYEEAFCIGTHGLNDVSRCVGWVSGGGSPQG